MNCPTCQTAMNKAGETALICPRCGHVGRVRVYHTGRPAKKLPPPLRWHDLKARARLGVKPHKPPPAPVVEEPEPEPEKPPKPIKLTTHQAEVLADLRNFGGHPFKPSELPGWVTNPKATLAVLLRAGKVKADGDFYLLA